MTTARKVALLLGGFCLIAGIAIGIAVPAHHHGAAHHAAQAQNQKRWDAIDAHLPAVLANYMHLYEDSITAGSDSHDPTDLIPYDRYGFTGDSLNGTQNVAVYVPPKATWAQVNTFIRAGKFSIDWNSEPEILTVDTAK